MIARERKGDEALPTTYRDRRDASMNDGALEGYDGCSRRANVRSLSYGSYF